MAISDQVRDPYSHDAGGATRGGLVPHSPSSGRGLWTPEEHLRFLEALDKFPSGPWKCIAEYVGNKTARQAMTHGQKYRQKIARRRRGLKKIVRDLQFAAVEVQDDGHEAVEAAEEEETDARLSVESNPMALSDQDFATFVASLDLAEELQLDALNASPLVVPNAAPFDQDIPSFSLEVDVPAPPTSETSDCGLPLTTTQQDVHHWVVMDRADASSEEFSAALAETFLSGCEEVDAYAFAKPSSLPEQLLDEYVQEQMNPLVVTDPALDGLESFEFDTFELR
ncbi:Myb domain [Phytophthora cactorum]|nr:Myb domain [Phytophthora cactorum]